MYPVPPAVASPASPASTTARPRQASQGNVGAKKFTPVRTLSRKSVRDPASDGKGWVLVNVEPSRKTSIDAAVAAIGRRRCCQRAGAELFDVEQPSVEQRRDGYGGDDDGVACGVVLPSRAHSGQHDRYARLACGSARWDGGIRGDIVFEEE